VGAEQYCRRLSLASIRLASLMIWLAILVFGLIAGSIGGVVGFGGSTILMPILAIGFGPKEAVPVMAIAGVLANMSRIVVWWREVDWRAAAVYCMAGIPCAAFGARTMLALDANLLELLLGIFFIGSIPVRRRLLDRGFRIGLPGLALAGAGIGYLSGLVASTGPLNTPFFLAHGLVKGAFVSTEALGSLGVFGTKAIVFRSFGALPSETIARGLIVGSSLMAGSWIAKRFMAHLEPKQFQLLMDAVLVLAGSTMFWSVWRAWT
jgi:uncharacterized protein